MRKLTDSKIVLASHNKGKLREIQVLLEPFGIECVSVGDLGLELSLIHISEPTRPY